MADANVPILGKTPKGAVLAGGLAVVAVGGYLLWKHFTTPKALPTPAAAAYGYGASAYGYTSALGYGYMPPGFGGGSYFPPYGYGPQPGPGYGGPPTTNGQWGQQAEADLGSSGTDSIAAAIGKYLAGAEITQDQALIVQEAEALLGPPPQQAASGFPPKMHVSKGPGPGQNAANPVTGLHVSQPGTTGVDIAWSASAGATSYSVTSTHGNPSMIGPTSARIHSINAPGHGGQSATVQVLAEPAASGATPATITVRTHK